MSMAWYYLFGPRLYKIYRDGPQARLYQSYQPYGLEDWADKLLTLINTLMNLSLYTSPFICVYLYRRGIFNMDETRSFGQLFGGIGCVVAFAFMGRAIGRSRSPKYVEFTKALATNTTDNTIYLQQLRKYDFEFKAWPVTYAVPHKASSIAFDNPFNKCANPHLPVLLRSLVQVLAFGATHTFGLRLIYPGSISVLNHLMWTALFEGRTALVEQYDGKRAKIKTADGNHIDTMFVDKRSRLPRGQILVVCTEGNSGFYEIGIMTTPIRAGYSTLGWNHPGFAGSTGLPYPSQEQNAIDAVMQYAINVLEFKPENIVLFGWSIGGYSSAWAALQYPDVRGLILDATFDDLLPLAENHMPSSWSLLVKEVIRSYVDLNVAELLTKYSGPVHLVRRTSDEIICLRPGQLSTNRGNDLVMKLIEARHPEVTKDMLELVRVYLALKDTQRAAVEKMELDENKKKLLQLISKYMRDYDSSHCTPLPEDVFKRIMRDILKTD